MASDNRVEADRAALASAQARGPVATLKTYVSLSGPGWLQSAMTLGGGSLGSSLYLGILGGASLLWLQPLAMLFGVVMLGAISYVTLSTGERPFRAINQHINPVLGWSWLIATLLANMVWALPQYSLCFAVCEQNFFPGLFGPGKVLDTSPGGSDAGKWLVSGLIFTVCTLVTWSYGSGSWGARLYDRVLKAAVAVIVLSFFAVVVRMAFAGDGINLSAIAAGLVPNPRQFFEPVESLRPLLDAISDPAARQYWSDLIVSQQRDVMLSAGAAAVGINMTFLLPYSLLNRGWGKEFRGLAIFDLSTGTFIPFVLATGCIIIASSAQFHTQLPDGFRLAEQGVEVPERFQKPYEKLVAGREAAAASGEYAIESPIDKAEQRIAGALVRRDTFDLASSLERLFQAGEGSSGRFLANAVFGGGVVAMTLSSISLMMLISGFAICEVLDRPASGWIFRLGCLPPAIGIAWPLLWDGDARAWLTVIAGVYGAMLLPIAYVTFAVMMNQRKLLGDAAPTGATRVTWNLLMAIAATAATAAGISAVWKKAGVSGLIFVAAYIALVIAVQLWRRPANSTAES
ncbi:MAG: hypothetical protein AAGF31_07655 [Planctomycetota bacterium]